MNINATVLGQVISFIFFVWFCMKYIWYPLISIIEKRQQVISDSLESVKKSKVETEHAKSEALSCLKQARITAQEIVKHAYKCQVKILHEAQYEANRERNNILFQAKEQVNQERKRVSDELKKQVSQLVIEAVEKIVEQSITEIADIDFINKIIKEIPFGD